MILSKKKKPGRRKKSSRGQINDPTYAYAAAVTGVAELTAAKPMKANVIASTDATIINAIPARQNLSLLEKKAMRSGISIPPLISSSAVRQKLTVDRLSLETMRSPSHPHETWVWTYARIAPIGSSVKVGTGIGIRSSFYIIVRFQPHSWQSTKKIADRQVQGKKRLYT